MLTVLAKKANFPEFNSGNQTKEKGDKPMDTSMVIVKRETTCNEVLRRVIDQSATSTDANCESWGESWSESG